VKLRLDLLRVCGPVACTLAAAACFSWRPYEPAAPLSASSGLPRRLRATLADSSRVELTAPFVRGDTLYGRSGPGHDTVAVAVAGVEGLERERFSPWRTFGVTVVAPAAALVAVYAIVCNDGGCQPTY
jgi:hypothetical protein